MSKNKATHRGTCQVCGCIQKLPGGHLSLHGYTVQWGFFSGTCCGSGALPFEQDKSLIDDAIQRALVQKADLEAQQAKLLAPVEPGTTKTWVRLFFGDKRNKFSDGYEWRETTITQQFNPYHDSKDGKDGYFTYHHDVPNDSKRPFHQWDRVCNYTYPKSIEEVVATLNKERSDFLQKTVDQITKYVSWQRQRIAGWKPQPLLPLK